MIASALFSTAITRAFSASVAIASESAPEPAPRSTTLTIPSMLEICCSTASTNSSLSGRGTNTPGPTSISRRRNGAVPVRYCKGSKPILRSTKVAKVSSIVCSSPMVARVLSKITGLCKSILVTPRQCANKCSASTCEIPDSSN